MEPGQRRWKRPRFGSPLQAPAFDKKAQGAALIGVQEVAAISLQATSKVLGQDLPGLQSTSNMPAASSAPSLEAGTTSNAFPQRKSSQTKSEKRGATLQKRSVPTCYDLSKIFGHGPLQHMALFVSALAEFVLLAHNLVTTIVAAEVDHWCKQPAEYSNLSTEGWRNIGIPLDADGRWLRCVRYDPPLSVASANRSTVPCESWDYGPGAGQSLAAEWDLVCDRRWLVTLSSFLYMSGAMTAAPFMGILSDEVGRRPVICVSVLVLLVSGTAICFTSTFSAFVVLRFCVSASVSTIQINTFILLFELCTSEYQCMYSVIAMASALTAAPFFLRIAGYFVGSWTMVQALMMLPTALLTSVFYMTVESPQWLLAKRRLQNVEAIVMWAARTNGLGVYETVHQWSVVSAAWQYAEMDRLNVTKYARGGFQGQRILLRRAVVVVWCWFVIIVFYYGRGLERGPTSLPLLVARVFLEVPCWYLLYHSMMTLGRRRTLWAVFIGFSVLVVSSALFSLHLDPALVTLIDSAIDVFVDMSVVLIFTFTVELFPTSVRSLGVFTGYFFGRVGGMAAPVLHEIGLFTRGEIASVALGSMGLLSALAVLYLPETMSVGIVDNINDLDEQRRQKKLHDFKLFMMRTSHRNSKVSNKSDSEQRPPASSQ